MEPLRQIAVVEIEDGVHVVEGPERCGVVERTAWGRVGDVEVGCATGGGCLVGHDGGHGLVEGVVAGVVPGSPQRGRAEEGVVVDVEGAKDHLVGVGGEQVVSTDKGRVGVLGGGGHGGQINGKGRVG